MKKLFFLSLVAALALFPLCGMSQIVKEPTTPHPDLAVRAQECVRQGSNVLFTFLLLNNGADLSYKLECAPGGTAQIVDDLGNQYHAMVYVGNRQTSFFPIATGVPVKVSVEIRNVASNAMGFPIIRLSGRAFNANESYSPQGDVTFWNIPIL